MRSRAASAAFIRQARQDLEMVLFSGNQSSKAGSIVRTYDELKTSYLQRVQDLHPDKHRTKSEREQKKVKNNFVVLNEAWERYDLVAKKAVKSSPKSNSSSDRASDFTMFGVGCSFDDTDVEKDLRSDIMDQASRGWFSAGALADDNSIPEARSKPTPVSLIDEDQFTDESEQEKDANQRSPSKNLLSDSPKYTR